MADIDDFSLTVVIPNYNNEKYIEKCINSVFEQTYSKMYQVIIVDDCSTDNSLQILEKLAEKYPKLYFVRLESNKGVSNARNMGLQLVQTKYVTFIDSDDFYFNSNKLKNEMELIIEYKMKYKKDILSYSSVVSAKNDLSHFTFPTKSRRAFLQGDIRFDLLKGKNFETIMRDYCISTQILHNIGGYNSSRNLYEDWEVLLKLSREIEFYCTFEYGTAYRQSINGLSKRPKSILKEKKYEIFCEEIQDINGWEKNEILFSKKIVDIKHEIKTQYYIFKISAIKILKKIKLYDKIKK